MYIDSETFSELPPHSDQEVLKLHGFMIHPKKSLGAIKGMIDTF